MRSVKRPGFDPYARSWLPNVSVEESNGHRDSAQINLVDGRAVFARVRSGRAVITVRSNGAWMGVGKVRDTVLIRPSAVTVDTMWITSTIPSDALKDSIDRQAGVVRVPPFNW